MTRCWWYFPSVSVCVAVMYVWNDLNLFVRSGTLHWSRPKTTIARACRSLIRQLQHDEALPYTYVVMLGKRETLQLR